MNDLNFLDPTNEISHNSEKHVSKSKELVQTAHTTSPTPKTPKYKNLTSFSVGPDSFGKAVAMKDLPRYSYLVMEQIC